MIRLRMGVADVARIRFGYSPLAEVVQSLYQLSSPGVSTLHRPWWEATRGRLPGVDMALLRAVLPANAYVADFLFSAASHPGGIDEQLRLVAQADVAEIRADVAAAWGRDPIPAPARDLVAEGAAGARRLADSLWRYWSVAIEPHWQQLRAVLEDDVAYRAAQLTTGGVDALLSGLHPEVSVRGEELRIDKRRHSVAHDLAGDGLTLFPSVFAWPRLMVDKAPGRPATLVYACRGVGRLWGRGSDQPGCDSDALGALLGQSRAAILGRLALPKSTTDLASELGQSPPSVSFHLSVLRRSGLVTSWRSGRRVVYRRTQLADGLVAASGPEGDGG
ncbi:ArsR/SmtB family transcription factor [Micromonospora sp. CPCC 206061]|uniref:ArsR/SmtB family transcription factor n=1 Tax=Micromonospora sp. CPCC 206061 TaxID=3122410 RepID=UPI002FF04280